MKKLIFLLLFVGFIAVSVQSSFAEDMAIYPDGNMGIYLNSADFGAYGDHLAIDLYSADGAASGVVLDGAGNAQFYLFLDRFGNMQISYDGVNWGPY